MSSLQSVTLNESRAKAAWHSHGRVELWSRCSVSPSIRTASGPADALFSQIARPGTSQRHHHAVPHRLCSHLSACHTRRYGSEAGLEELRESIAGAFYGDTVIKPSEIFVSDGSKCDIGRLQMMFGSQASVALQV